LGLSVEGGRYLSGLDGSGVGRRLDLLVDEDDFWNRCCFVWSFLLVMLMVVLMVLTVDLVGLIKASQLSSKVLHTANNTVKRVDTIIAMIE